MIQIVLVALAFVFAFSNNGLCREFHVSAVTGSNQNTGDAQYPLKTIQAAAERVLPGDKVIVHAGVYRERVNPIQGGTEKQPIIFQAAEGEKVEIKGSEVIKKWKHVNRHTWMVKIPNSFFQKFNPYSCLLYTSRCV